MRIIYGIVFYLLVILLFVSLGFTLHYSDSISHHRIMFGIWVSALVVSVCGLGLYALDSALSMIR